jgi:hypothetical protein
VIVVNGDGAMLMNLGSLVTITAAAPANLVLILADNGVYEVTEHRPLRARQSCGRIDVDLLEWRTPGAGSAHRFSNAQWNLRSTILRPPARRLSSRRASGRAPLGLPPAGGGTRKALRDELGRYTLRVS